MSEPLLPQILADIRARYAPTPDLSRGGESYSANGGATEPPVAITCVIPDSPLTGSGGSGPPAQNILPVPSDVKDSGVVQAEPEWRGQNVSTLENLSVRGGADPSEKSGLGASAATTAKAAIESYSTGEAQVSHPPSFESCICGGQSLSSSGEHQPHKSGVLRPVDHAGTNVDGDDPLFAQNISSPVHNQTVAGTPPAGAGNSFAAECIAQLGRRFV